MRYVCQFTAIAVLSLLAAPKAQGQTVPGLSITNYQFVSEQRMSRTHSYVTYRADLVNSGPARAAVTATVTSPTPSVEVVAGQANLRFSPVPAGGRVTSSNTFTLLVDRTVSFDVNTLRWTFLTPWADAGPNQTVKIGDTVTLDGSRSSNPSGVGTLSYNWAFVTRPYGTGARLMGADSMVASFTVDVAGEYVLRLTVNNGMGTDSALVKISTVNSPPVAKAGPNQTVTVGSTVVLNGSGSSDVDGDALTYSWSFLSRAPNSAAVLSGANTVSPSFVADKPGTYLVNLVVKDGLAESKASTVQITTQNSAPVANAGQNQSVKVGAVVQLNGSGSTDIDGDALTYSWRFNALPAGSKAVLSNPAAVNPTFTADAPGTYAVQLIVRDGKVDSDPSTVTITTDTVQAPTANAGTNQTVKHGETVMLNGSGTDPQGLSLTYHWSISTMPGGSAAVLSSTTAPRTTFVADVPGQYVVQLVVNNGYVNSPAATVTITTTNTAPVANAGENQTVQVGATVFLDGSRSADADGDALTYSWSLLKTPDGSGAVLSAPTSATPTFVADVAGTYIAQLIVSDRFAKSNPPATVTITAGVKAITLSPSPLNLARNTTGSLTVAIGSPAGAGGLEVRLASSDGSVLSVPSIVRIAEGQTSATVTVTAGVAGSALILATATGFSPGSVTANVTIPSIALTLEATTIGMTGSTKATVTLSDPALQGGTIVSLQASPGGVVTIPASVTVASGNTATFTVAAAGVGTTTITASVPGFTSGSASITVKNLGAIKLASDVSVGPGQSTAFGVTLVSAAPPGGVRVNLRSSDTSIATITASVFIPQGAIRPDEPAQVTGVNFGSATISATAAGYEGDLQSVRVVGTLSFTPNLLTLGAGGSGNLTLTLSSPAPGSGVTVALRSDGTGVATVPASILIPGGSTQVSVPVTAVAAGSTTIHASAAPHLADTTATVTVAVLGTIILPANANVATGESVAFPVALSSPAPAGGTTVTLTISDNSKLSISTAVVMIDTGRTTPSVQPVITGKLPGTVSISAKAAAYGSASVSVTVTGGLSFSEQPINVQVGATKTVMVNVPTPATAPIVVALVSDNTGVATVTASVTIPVNALGASVSLKGVSTGSTKIRATATGFNPAEATVNVQALGTINLPTNLSVPLGGSTQFAVTLPQAAAAAVTITLTSSDTSKLTISPGTITIPQGQTAPSTQPQVTGVSLGSANITAKATGYADATQAVKVNATLSFVPASVTISGLKKQNVVVKLSAVTPVPVSVALSSDNATIATVPSTATIAANSDSATVQVTAVALGGTTIRASALPSVPEVSAPVTVQSAGKIQVPANTSVALSKSAAFNVSLPAAPESDVTINLSSDNAAVTISPASVTVAANATAPAVQPQVTGVNIGSAHITASAAGYTSSTAPVSVTASLSFAKTDLTVGRGASQTVMLNLSAPAPSPVTISLASDNATIATVANSVTIPANAAGVNVAVNGVATGATVIRASGPAGVSGATLNVSVGSDIILPAEITVGPGEQVALPISIAQPAVQTIFVQLSSSDTSKATLQQSTVTIQANQTQPAFPPRINGITFGTATITATAIELGTATTTVKVGAALGVTVSSLTLAPGTSQSIGITLSSAAPASGLLVKLNSSNTSIATVPASVTIPAGQSAASIQVTGVAVGSATINVTSDVPTVTGTSASVTVATPGTLVLPASFISKMGESSVYPISLSSPAGANGVTVTLDASAANVSFVPLTCTGTPCPPVPPTATHTTVFIGQGRTEPLSQPVMRGVTPGSITVTATAPGYTTATKPVQVTATFAFAETELTLSPGTTGHLRLVFSGAAPPGPDGLRVSFTSSMPGVATVTSSVAAIWDGSSPTTLLIPVTAVAAGTTKITASAPYMTDATATVTVSGPVSISTTSLPDGVVGRAYNATVQAGGGKQPYTWSAPGLPALGLRINEGTEGTGVISGTPSAAGTTSVRITVTDSTSPTTQTAYRDLSITIAPALTITTTALPGGVVGAAYNFTLTAANGKTPYTWAVTGLPANLTFNASTGLISGTPAAAGTSSVQITVTDSSTVPQTSTKTLPLTIAEGLHITTPSPLPDGLVGSAYTAQLAAKGGTTPYTWSATGLPAPLQMTTTGAITGTPTTPGTSTVRVTVKDAGNLTNTVDLALTINGIIVVSPAALPNGVVGLAYSQTLSASGGIAPYTWVVTGLPAGLSFNPTTRVISGTPSARGTSSIGITATDANHQTGTKTLSLTIVDPVNITTASPLPNAAVNTAYSVTLARTGGTAPYTWSATGLPAGLSINPTTGEISGTATAAATASVVVTVKDSSGPPQSTDTATFSLSVVTAPTITTSSLPDGTTGTSYSAQLAASGGTSPYTWAATGLPAGLTLNPTTGAISGTPTGAAGESTVNITVTDSTTPTHLTGTRSLKLLIEVPPSITTASPLPNGSVNAPYTASVEASGGTRPYAWSATGLPTGLGIDAATGAISGTPTAVATSTVAVKVTDAKSRSATKNLSLTIGAAVPASIVANGGSGQSVVILTAFPTPLQVIVRDASNAPVANVTVQFAAPASGASLAFGSSGNTFAVKTNTAGMATTPAMTANGTVGTYAVTATVAGLPAATFSLTNLPVQTLGKIALSTASVGRNLETTLVAQLPAPAGPGGVTITLTSNKPTLVGLGRNGKDAIQVTIPETQNQAAVYIQSLGTTGSAIITATANGYTDGTATVNVTPSGFVLAGPNDVGASFQTYKDMSTKMTVYPARLDSAGRYAEKQALRASFYPTTVTVNVVSTATGQVTPSSVTFNAGDTSAQVTFKALETGTATVTAETPADFTAVTDRTNIVDVAVLSSGLKPPTDLPAIGANLQWSAFITLEGVVPAGPKVPLTLTSADPNRLKFAASPTAAGSGTLTLELEPGARSSPEFYIQAFGAAGSVGYTAQAAGFGSANSTVTIAPSGVVFTNAYGGPPNPILAAVGGSAVNVNVYTAALSTTGGWLATQPLAGGLSTTVSVTITQNPTVGSIVPVQVTIPGGSSSGTTQFRPGVAGTTQVNLSVPTSPTGFSTPSAQYKSVAATVTVSKIRLSVADIPIGKDLQMEGDIGLSQPAPAGGFVVRLQTTAGQIQFSASPTANGSNPLDITVPEGQMSVKYYVQALGDSGTASYKASGTGYTDGTASVTLTPSGVVMGDQYWLPFLTLASGVNTATVRVAMAQLDPSTGAYANLQPLRGGRSLSVTVRSNSTAIVTIDTPVTISGGADPASATTTVRRAGLGKTTVSAVQPAGFVDATNGIFSGQPTSTISVETK